MDFTLAISALQLLYNIYAERLKRGEHGANPNPEKVREIIDELSIGEPKTLDSKSINNLIDKKFEPAEAKILREDFSVLNLIVQPPPLDAFDYWGVLSRFVSALQLLAITNHVFKLRGRKLSSEDAILDLPKTSKSILAAYPVRTVPKPRSEEDLNHVIPRALLSSAPSEFPIRIVLEAVFNQYSSMGGKSQRGDFAIYNISAGQERHWLRLIQKETSYCFTHNFEFMLTAQQFKAILVALRDDIHDVIREINEDAITASPLMKQIGEFLSQLST